MIFLFLFLGNFSMGVQTYSHHCISQYRHKTQSYIQFYPALKLIYKTCTRYLCL